MIFRNPGNAFLPELPNFAPPDKSSDNRAPTYGWFGPGDYWFDLRNSYMPINSELCSGIIYHYIYYDEPDLRTAAISGDFRASVRCVRDRN